MNFAIGYNSRFNLDYTELNQFIIDTILESEMICSYYLADIIYNNMELVEPFYIDINDNSVCWVNDWYEGGKIYSLFGFIDSETIRDYTIKYLWRNRYRGGFKFKNE